MNELQGNSIALLEVRRKEGRKGIPEVNKRGKLYCKIKKTFVIRQETDGRDGLDIAFIPSIYEGFQHVSGAGGMS